MKTFSLANAPHLPVTGESHPLIQESTRWLTTGNAVAALGALVLFGSWYAWSQMAPDTPPPTNIPGIIYIDRVAEPTPPQAEPRSSAPSGRTAPVEDRLATPDPVTNADPQDSPPLEPWDRDPGYGIPGDEPIVVSGFNDTPPDTLIPFDELPVLLSIGAPVYPYLAKTAGIDGTVLVKVFVSRAGKVKNAVAVEGPEVLRNAAVDAAMTALFEPALQGDKPVDVWVMIPVTFSLNR